MLTEQWGTIPLAPLRRVVSEGLAGDSVPHFVEMGGVDDRQSTLVEWRTVQESNPGDVIRRIALEERSPEAPMVHYDLSKREVVVNLSHPFSQNYSQTKEEKQLLRDTSLVDLLTEAFMVDLGLPEDQVQQIQDYRDQTFRLVAKVRRRTGPQIEDLLMKSATSHAEGFEHAVGDALEYLGFVVLRLGQPGKPEGVASAPMTRGRDDEEFSYRFTYDAKSTRSEEKTKSKTSNLNMAGLRRHRKNYNAQYSLVIAPGYEGGALQQECTDQEVTPIRAADLAELLRLVYKAGPINLRRFREIFTLRDPDDVHGWVQDFVAISESNNGIPLGVFLRALEEIGFNQPDALNTAVVAMHIRRMPNGFAEATQKQVANLVQGLSVFAPRLIQLVGPQTITLGVSPEVLRSEILKQMHEYPSQRHLDLEDKLGRIARAPGESRRSMKRRSNR